MTKTTNKTPTATSLNVFALANAAADGGLQADGSFANRCKPTSRTHLRRCMAAGLVEFVNASTLRLTPAGVAAVIPHLKTRIAQVTAPHPHGYARTAYELHDLAVCQAALLSLGAL